eukprot:590606-Prorocentrum_minimum.AAC.1
MVEFADAHGGICRRTWWNFPTHMVEFSDAHGGIRGLHVPSGPPLGVPLPGPCLRSNSSNCDSNINPVGRVPSTSAGIRST